MFAYKTVYICVLAVFELKLKWNLIYKQMYFHMDYENGN